ncbi:DUF4331 family protein [Streptomyces collinus]
MVQLERMGRPEIKNVVMSSKKYDTVNRDLEIRDLYHEEDTFNIRPDYAGAYRARFNANLVWFDGLDGKTQRLLYEQDFLVVDLAKPCSEDSCFEIETALPAGRPHTTCGGRSLNDDIVDTLLVGGVDGERFSDGVDQATKPTKPAKTAKTATHAFPYLNAPTPTPPDRAPAWPRSCLPRKGHDRGVGPGVRAGHDERHHRRHESAGADRRAGGTAQPNRCGGDAGRILLSSPKWQRWSRSCPRLRTEPPNPAALAPGLPSRRRSRRRPARTSRSQQCSAEGSMLSRTTRHHPIKFTSCMGSTRMRLRPQVTSVGDSRGRHWCLLWHSGPYLQVGRAE